MVLFKVQNPKIYYAMPEYAGNFAAGLQRYGKPKIFE